ncbi:hypothetical protein [Arthrobacter sp. SX1312]|uniref:hypothetical protein n=1 Tax=Arthrobacter sp. SX1312 TaxID=2058896 RepID=UPI000CE47017|nr:hypothetical protein [Arthrobacter sp. SX1312]
MNVNQMDPTFAQGLRTALIEQVNATSPARVRRHRWWIGAGVFAGIGLIGGVGATAAGFLVEPGADVVTEYGNPVSGTYTGPQTIELGAAPDSATSIMVELTCLSGGSIYLPDGAGTTCPDIGTGAITSTSLALSPGQNSLEVRTSAADVSYQAHITYTSTTPTDWAVNENGDTYGATNARGEPDLISVITTDGKLGYVYADELNEASGKTASTEFTSPSEAQSWQEARQGTVALIPVYESDGETVIGEFEAGRW